MVTPGCMDAGQFRPAPGASAYPRCAWCARRLAQQRAVEELGIERALDEGLLVGARLHARPRPDAGSSAGPTRTTTAAVRPAYARQRGGRWLSGPRARRARQVEIGGGVGIAGGEPGLAARDRRRSRPPRGRGPSPVRLCFDRAGIRRVSFDEADTQAVAVGWAGVYPVAPTTLPKSACTAPARGPGVSAFTGEGPHRTDQRPLGKTVEQEADEPRHQGIGSAELVPAGVGPDVVRRAPSVGIDGSPDMCEER